MGDQPGQQQQQQQWQQQPPPPAHGPQPQYGQPQQQQPPPAYGPQPQYDAQLQYDPEQQEPQGQPQSRKDDSHCKAVAAIIFGSLGFCSNIYCAIAGIVLGSKVVCGKSQELGSEEARRIRDKQYSCAGLTFSLISFISTWITVIVAICILVHFGII